MEQIKLPLRVVKGKDYGVWIEDADGLFVVRFDVRYTTESNERLAASFIRACNHHDALVAFLKTLENQIRCGSLQDIVKEAATLLAQIGCE